MLIINGVDQSDLLRQMRSLVITIAEDGKTVIVEPQK
jgi:hypothetical protein